jgi:hypothetical protein
LHDHHARVQGWDVRLTTIASRVFAWGIEAKRVALSQFDPSRLPALADVKCRNAGY